MNARKKHERHALGSSMLTAPTCLRIASAHGLMAEARLANLSLFQCPGAHLLVPRPGGLWRLKSTGLWRCWRVTEVGFRSDGHLVGGIPHKRIK